jgi:hypothetical protein
MVWMRAAARIRPLIVDTDGDGVVDTDDQRPDQGDQGNGVDASGCLNPL